MLNNEGIREEIFNDTIHITNTTRDKEKNEKTWRYYCKSISFDYVRTVRLARCSLSKVSDEIWDLFCKSLKNPEIEMITFINLRLGNLPEKRFNDLYNSIKSCELLRNVDISDSKYPLIKEKLDVLQAVPIANQNHIKEVKGIFFAAGHSLLNKPTSNTNYNSNGRLKGKSRRKKKKTTQQNTGTHDLNRSQLPLDCVKYILTYLESVRGISKNRQEKLFKSVFSPPNSIKLIR